MDDGAPDVPAGLSLVRTTPDFDAESVPRALLSAHVVADGVWARLCVVAGTVEFVFESGRDAPRLVEAGCHQAIPPGRPHHITPGDGARFHIEFYR